MQTIFKLPDHLIAQIAAGEVIERPAYVVKELVENALDAGADVIRIDIANGGLTRIAVADNGRGMSSEDVLVCSTLHATNKITNTDSLTAIKTLGFRGEALASISAVSRITIQSRTGDDNAGTKISLDSGRISHTGAVGMPTGTVVTVEELFGTTPGRKKFLKSPQTELRHILEIVMLFGLSYPNVSFKLTHNTKKLLDLSPQSPVERIRSIAGDGPAKQSIPVRMSESYLSVEGYITHPQLAFIGMEKLYLFINRRAVRDKLIASAIREAYGNLLEPSSYPFAVLSCTLPFEFVDVNVHPRKERVSFTDSQFLYTVVRKAIYQALERNNLTFHTMMQDGQYTPLSEMKPTTSIAGKLLKEAVEPWNTQLVGQREPDGEIIQIHNTYLVAPTRQGVLLIDVHALHEKLLYERYKKEFFEQRNKRISVRLPKPLSLTLQITDVAVVEEYTVVIKKMGFDFRKTKEGYMLHSVPAFLKDRDVVRICKEFIEDVKRERPPRAIDSISEKMLAYLACRTAIKAGQALTREQIKELMSEMDKHPEIVTCPHGRPVKLELSLGELHKLFRRT